jgi:hypothetical protein
MNFEKILKLASIVFSSMLLVLNTFNFFPVSTLTKFLNAQNVVKHSFSLRKKLTKGFLEKSLMKVMKYLVPLKDGTLVGP